MEKYIKKLRKYTSDIIINVILMGIGALITTIIMSLILQSFSIFQIFGIPAIIAINVLLANILGYLIVGKLDEE